MTDTATGSEIDALLARAVEASAAVQPHEVVVAPPARTEPGAVPTGPRTRDELRRLTIVFSDLVGSTSLSGSLDPERYRALLAFYKGVCHDAIEEFDGNLVHSRGDGILAVFGHPVAHEDDARRAVLAGLAIHRELERRAPETPDLPDVPLLARVGIHRGLVYLEHDSNEMYGLAVNVAARVQEATDPGTVAVSDEVRELLGDLVSTEPLEPRPMKGVDRPPALHRVLEHDADEHHLVRRWSQPMVGRDDVRDRIVERIRRNADSTQAVLLLGEAGIGKSRLAAAVVEELDRTGTVLELAGSPRRRLGLHPVRVLVQELAQVRDDRPGDEQLHQLRDHLDAHDLGRLLPALAPVLGIGPEAGYDPLMLDPSRLESHIADAVFTYLVTQLQGPALLVVEDLHWIDPQTMAIVDRLVREGPSGCVVLMTSREPSDCGADVTWVEHLEPLDERATDALIDLLDAEVDEEARAAIRSRCDGVPLYIEELLRTGVPTPAEGVIEAPEPEAAVPPALYDSLYARLNALSEELPVLTAAAAIGRMVSLDVLASVTGLSTDALDHSVTTLIDEQVLEPVRGDSRRVRFRHELLREVAYEIEPPSGQRQLHGRIAGILRERSVGNAEWERIAHHHHVGEDPGAAADALHHAAEDARRRGSLAEARTHLGRAIALVLDAPDDAARDVQEIRLRLRRAFLAVSAEGFASEDAAEDYRCCLELCVDDAAGDPLYETLIALWGYYVNRSDLVRAKSISTALGHLSVGPRVPMLPTNIAGHGMIDWYSGRCEQAAELLGAAVARIEDIGVDEQSTPDAWTMPTDPVASMHVHHALARFWVGDLSGASEEFERARDRCRALPFPLGPFTETYVLMLGTWMDLERDEVSKALQRAVEAGTLAGEHGFEAWLLWSSIAQGAIAAQAEPGPETAQRCADSASLLELFHALGVRILSGSIQTTLARALLAAGDPEAAADEAAKAVEWAESTGSVAFLPQSMHVRAIAGPADQRERGLLDALDLATEHGNAVARLRIAHDLVEHVGDAHRTSLRDALEPFDDDAACSVVTSARQLLAR